MKNKNGYIIIDLGTGNIRVAVCSVQGEILNVVRADLQNEKDALYPEALCFDPDALWLQVRAMAVEALSKITNVNILAITATSQREGIVLIDKDGSSLIGLPNIDHRGREWEAQIQDKDLVYSLSGRYPTSLFSAPKLVGIRARRPEIWSRTACFLSISDWVEYRLSGVLHYEHSQASETLLFDVQKAEWSTALCEIFGINRCMLPPLVASGTVLSSILAEEAAAFKISPDTKIVVGGGDTQLAIMSTQPQEGDVVIVSGTTTPIIKVTESFFQDEAQRTWTSRHTDGKSFIVEANAGVTGLNYQRLKEIFYPNEDYAMIEQELQAVVDVQCTAALGSLIADEKRPLIRGGFVFNTPVSHTLSRACFVWATLWDIACSIVENYKTLNELDPHNKEYLWACGGGLQSKLLRQLIANLTGKKVIVRSNYIQSSVAGGLNICNLAMGLPLAPVYTSEEILPEHNEGQEQLYADWKKTRSSFIETMPV